MSRALTTQRKELRMIATKLIPPLSQRDKERFWNTVEKTDSCWLWRGGKTASRYGIFFAGKSFRAHRISFVISGGKFCNGSLVLHGCRNRHCVNPAHLYSGTQKQNCADKERDGTVARGDRSGPRRHPEIVRGERNGNAKLTEDAVREMRTMHFSGIPYTQLAWSFGVTPTQVQYICERRNWKQVE